MAHRLQWTRDMITGHGPLATAQPGTNLKGNEYMKDGLIYLPGLGIHSDQHLADLKAGTSCLLWFGNPMVADTAGRVKRRRADAVLYAAPKGDKFYLVPGVSTEVKARERIRDPHAHAVIEEPDAESTLWTWHMVRSVAERFGG